MSSCAKQPKVVLFLVAEIGAILTPFRGPAPDFQFEARKIPPLLHFPESLGCIHICMYIFTYILLYVLCYILSLVFSLAFYETAHPPLVSSFLAFFSALLMALCSSLFFRSSYARIFLRYVSRKGFDSHVGAPRTIIDGMILVETRSSPIPSPFSAFAILVARPAAFSR